jgi:ABC-type glutathione transport system ATPase component
VTHPILQVQDLHVELEAAGNTPVRPVDGVSFDVRAGETLGLVGESGCGKTMTAFSIIGLLPPNGRITSGSVVFEGEDLSRLRPAELRRIRKRCPLAQDICVSVEPPLVQHASGQRVACHFPLDNAAATPAPVMAASTRVPVS